MKKVILFIYALSISFSSFAQEEIITFNNYLKTSSLSITDAVPLVNDKTGETSLIFVDPKKIYGYLLDSNFKVTKDFVSDNRSKKYKTIIGSISSDNNYLLFLSNNRRNKFASLKFSYENDNSEITEIPLELDNERFIQIAELNNKFYLFTITRYSSILNVYVFDKSSNYKKNEINLTEHFDEDDNLYDFLTVTADGSIRKVVDINKIEDSNPNAIEITSEISKMYQQGSKVLFSFDDFKDFTKVVTLDLKDFKYEVIEFDKPFGDIKSKSTNSFINGNEIYMVAATNEDFNFSVYDFETGNLLKAYNVDVDSIIPFKNTPIIQVGGQYDKYRELEKTQKFLRKVRNGDIGISVFKHKDLFQITMGGKQEIRTTSAVGFGGSSVSISGGGPPVMVFFNPTLFAYGSYTRTKSIHFKGLFDENYNHVKGEVEKNAFDKMKNYEDENKVFQKGKSVFRYKDYYILGSFSRWPKKEYNLRRFNN
ncbi:hypothetical protein FF125_00970 [Aureibaculum algae]|uniref:WD40 repeat domain-containing protein n=1 Tax=Aureibaculum algae TaxID=2584122 RepID=A0A5B7TPN1_9FLAO|nr:hypothetical protein [Aureibaculum algae]QCX37076.1 hypothetical protein FF125_00970 [Aureibaculum algae]